MAKTPISYYGGKQTMLKHILPLIPEHTTYTESFCGGAAVFFAKQPCEVEVINDTNSELMNFYQVLKEWPADLQNELDKTIYSRDLHTFANIIYNYPQFFSRVRRAWALWVLSKMSFASRLDGSFGYEKTKNTTTKKMVNAKNEEYIKTVIERMKFVQLENRDALIVIKSRDNENTFHFIDPPYIGTDLGHYKGYNEQNFIDLLNLCSQLKGKFILTMFPDKILKEHIKKNKWNVVEVERTISASKTTRRKQVELIVMNY